MVEASLPGTDGGCLVFRCQDVLALDERLDVFVAD
jgi:hypothetical protein